MQADTAARPARSRTGPHSQQNHRALGGITASSVLDGHADVAEVVAAGRMVPAVDLISWAVGYGDGWDARDATTTPAWHWRYAEGIAELDRQSWLPAARVMRDRRLAREEQANTDRAVTMVQTADWPPITMPGTGARA